MPLNPSIQETIHPQSQSKLILFGEDDLDEVDFLKEIFYNINESFSLQFINNGRNLLNTLAAMPVEQLPCLIVLDYNMPGLNGAEILKELKQNPRYDAIPKIIWSTSGSDVYKKICLDSGANDYIIKPANLRELETIARHMLSFCPS